MPDPTRVSHLLALPILALALLAAGCSSSIPTCQGPGLYSDYDAERLAQIGFPNTLDQPYWWPAASEGEWGLLYDDEGIAYGPNSFYHFKSRKDHPELAVTDSTMTGRWATLNRHERATEYLFGRWLELLDLAYMDMVALFEYQPPDKFDVTCTADLDEYAMVTGHEYWVTHEVDGNRITFEPIRILFSRGLAYHAVCNAVAQSFIDQKCRGQAPAWFTQGVAAYLGEEGNVLFNFSQEFRVRRDVVWPPSQTIEHIDPLVDRENGRIALYNSFLMAWHLIETWGWDCVKQLTDEMAAGKSFAEAVKAVYGIDEAELLQQLDPTVNGEPMPSDFEPTFE